MVSNYSGGFEMTCKLTEDDIKLIIEPTSNLYPYTIHIKCNWDDREQLKKQILANQNLRELTEKRILDLNNSEEQHRKYNGYDLAQLCSTVKKELQTILIESEK